MDQDRQQLQEYLREQVGFLRKNGAAFDGGDVAEAKQMATTIRTLVHEFGRSKSLLRQLKVKEKLRFIDSSSQRPRGAAVVFGSGLAVIRTDFDAVTTTYAAPLEGRARRAPLLFDPWWSQRVLDDQEDKRFSRKDLVLGLAHKEGGAHVDLDMNRAYERLVRSNSLGWEFGKGDVWVPAGSPVPANVRQICWELQATLEEQIPGLLGLPV